MLHRVNQSYSKPVGIVTWFSFFSRLANLGVRLFNTLSTRRGLFSVAEALVYRMLKYGQEYVTQSMEEYEAKVQAKILKSLKRKAAALGFQLSPLPTQLGETCTFRDFLRL